MNNKCDEKILETVAFSNRCICSAELIQWEHTHFHPSGKTVPSSDDLKSTRRIKECSDIMGLDFLDHIIIGDDYISLREEMFL